MVKKRGQIKKRGYFKSEIEPLHYLTKEFCLQQQKLAHDQCVIWNAMASCNRHPGHGLVLVIIVVSRDTHEGRKEWEADSTALDSMTHTQLTN
ncbi:hypothetical protein E2C01_022704 [Portunus trituberculatus]|uniref:Uncharacterized protein n=1 Tax=Portunus trituberculatus TaxID=210409 RepID=A0A5B7E7T5_PORTR|nr:hypothetical protein [Portunus trituberculatus]